MNSSKFKEKQLKYLDSLLNCSPTEIEYLCNNIQSYYGKRVEQKKDKTTGKVKTFLDGTPKFRIIRPSYRRLKEIQKAIKNNILAKVELPENVQGGVKKKSNISNARRHKGNKYQFTTDLLNFFPRINHNNIFSMFLRIGYSNHIAYWLTKLTSIEFELPQGTPTSTHIANLVFLPTDYKLISLANKNNLVYTRYVDDITLSSQQDFKQEINEILRVIESNGFKISFRKTKYHGDQIITGIQVFNNYIDAPETIKSKVKNERVVQPLQKPYTSYLSRIHDANKKKSKKKILK